MLDGNHRGKESHEDCQHDGSSVRLVLYECAEALTVAAEREP
jgi:hypothetical protein